MGRGYNWMAACIAGSGSMLYGYDAAVIASTFAQEGFISYFKPSAKILGAIGSSYYGGVVVGLLFVSLLADRFGRKRTLQFGGVVGLIGAILQTAASNIGTFFAGRVIAGAASGIMLTTVNVYQSEIAPPGARGAMVAFQILSLTIAGTLASWIGYGSNYSANPQIQWRVPIALQCVPALGLIIGCFFIPFSPRWRKFYYDVTHANKLVVMKGRHEEAKVVLRRLHDDDEDPLFWEKEYLQIAAQIKQEQEEQATVSWSHIISDRRELKRVLIAVASLACVQTNGAQTIQVYQSILYGGLGFSVRNTLLMSGVFGICNNLGGAVNLVLIDRVGRRLLFLSGFVLLSICLAMFAAFSAKYQETGAKGWGKAGVSMVMVFIFFFGCTFAASPYAYAAEVLPTKIRANGVAIALFAAQACVIIFSQCAPIALQAITWKFNFVFIGCNIFFFPIVYFFFPETKGLSLEEINALFGEKVAVRIADISDKDAEREITKMENSDMASSGSGKVQEIHHEKM